MNQQKEIIVVGHKSPDTDSICSAIAYANLKNKLTGQQYTPRRAGDLNKETAFALSYFGVEPPAYLADVRTRVSDMEIKEVPAVNAKISIKQAYSLMKECEASTLCITNEENHLEGLITISNVAASDMDVYDNRIVSKAKTPYENIVKVLEAKVICGDVSGTFDQGRVTIAANTPERMVDYVAEHDMVIIGNRFESQFFAIEIGASCIILCTNAEPNETIIERAKSKGCIILSSPYDSYTVARLINQSMPIDFFMTAHHILSFSLEDYTDDVKEVMARERHRYFPVLDEHGCYIGQLSKRSFLAAQKNSLSWWTTTKRTRRSTESSAPTSSRSSTTTVWADWKASIRSTSATSRWAALPPSSISSTVKMQWKSSRRLPDCFAPPFCRTH